MDEALTVSRFDSIYNQNIKTYIHCSLKLVTESSNTSGLLKSRVEGWGLPSIPVQLLIFLQPVARLLTI